MADHIQVRGLRKIYTRGANTIVVLDGVDLDVDGGEFVALMGPSGSGKTTLLNIIAGIDRSDAGTVTVDGADVTAMSDSQQTAWRTHNLGYIFQFYNLLPVVTAWENVELPLLVLSLSKQQRREHVAAALEAVGASDRMKHYPRQMSGGQEQRVAIARAIVTDARIIVADEPTGNLDAAAEKEIMELLRRLCDELGKTMILVTHDATAAAYADRVVHLEKGHIVPQEEVQSHVR